MTKGEARVFSVQNVAVLTYLGMARLARRQRGQEDKIEAIREAYKLVGIT